MLKTALNTMQSINQSLETTEIKLDYDDGIDLCDVGKKTSGKKENAAYHNLLLFQKMFSNLFLYGVVEAQDCVVKG